MAPRFSLNGVVDDEKDAGTITHLKFEYTPDISCTETMNITKDGALVYISPFVTELGQNPIRDSERVLIGVAQIRGGHLCFDEDVEIRIPKTFIPYRFLVKCSESGMDMYVPIKNARYNFEPSR